MFLFLCEVEGEEVKFVQAWWVQRGGARLSHTRWRKKGQRWHSLAEEWKTFSPENREATTGRVRAGRPWVSLHPFGETTCLKMQMRALVCLAVEIISCHLQKPAWNVILRQWERLHVQRGSCGSERGRQESRALNIWKIWAESTVAQNT